MKMIPLTQDKFALVDDCDYGRLKEFNWCAHKDRRRFYALRHKPGGGTIHMHHEIMPPPPGREIDHINGNGLDNRRTNLRSSTRLENVRGFKVKRRGATSEFRGVCFYKALGRWHARIKTEKKHIHLGYFDLETDAARAYDAAARQYFGEFAQPNFKI